MNVDQDLLLPPGRVRAELDEIRKTWGFNDHRRALLDELETFVDVLRTVIPVNALWLSGSYLTGKENPNDIDAVFLVDHDRIARLESDASRRILTVEGLRILARTFSLRIDPYLLPWRARPATAVDDDVDRNCLRIRGYWDDFWMRMRTVPKGSTPTRQCALPRRGYVEVIIDDFT